VWGKRGLSKILRAQESEKMMRRATESRMEQTSLRAKEGRGKRGCVCDKKKTRKSSRTSKKKKGGYIHPMGGSEKPQERKRFHPAPLTSGTRKRAATREKGVGGGTSEKNSHIRKKK